MYDLAFYHRLFHFQSLVVFGIFIAAVLTVAVIIDARTYKS